MGLKMNMHTALDHYHGGAPIVDKMLGNAYQTVRLVAHYIEEVRHVSHHMKQVYDVSKFLPAIQTVANTETQIKGLSIYIKYLWSRKLLTYLISVFWTSSM